MKNEMKKYLNYIREVNKEEKIKNKKEILEDLLTQISFFQHERFVHLIVTVFVGISAILFIGLGLQYDYLGFVFLSIITMILFMFYIFHYYFLENSTQELYKIYEEIRKNKRNY